MITKEGYKVIKAIIDEISLSDEEIELFIKEMNKPNNRIYCEVCNKEPYVCMDEKGRKLCNNINCFCK